MNPRCLCTVVLLLAVALSSRAAASDPLAESLFQEGLSLLRDGETDAACMKLAASFERESKSGTLISLAFCHERQGRTATAWAEYKEAAVLAGNEGRDEYNNKATALAATLEPKLSKIQIKAPDLHSGVELEVRLDDVLVLTGTFGTALAIDPGEHVVTASAKGYDSWSTTVTVGRVADTQVVEVPALVRAAEAVLPPAPPSSQTAPAPARSPAPTGADGADSSGLRDLTVAGLVVGAVGLATLGVGLGLGAVVLGDKATVEEQCDLVSRRCTQAGLDAADSGGSTASVSTALSAVGGIAVATGVVLVLIDMGEESDSLDTSLRARPTLGGTMLMLEGTF